MMTIIFWIIGATLAAGLAAVIAVRKGRRLRKWVPYALLAWPIALPHLMMKRSRKHY